MIILRTTKVTVTFKRYINMYGFDEITKLQIRDGKVRTLQRFSFSKHTPELNVNNFMSMVISFIRNLCGKL